MAARAFRVLQLNVLLISFALIFFSKNDRNLLFGSPPNPLQSCSGSDCQNNRAWSGLGGADKVQNNCPRLKGLVPEFLRYRCLDTYELLNKSWLSIAFLTDFSCLIIVPRK